MAEREQRPRHPALDTERFRQDLGRRAVRGTRIVVIAQVLRSVVQAGALLLLARLLVPGDFGLIAMVTVVTGLVAKLRDAGLSAATIQREDITHAQVNTLFWFNAALGLGLGLLVAALAPAMVAFFRQPDLLWVTVAIALVFPLGGLQVQHEALLRRQMRFKAVAVVELVSVAAGVITALALAWSGAGYWALVAQMLVAAAVSCALATALSGWRPGRPAWGAGVGSLISFGGSLTLASIINYFGSTVDDLLLGRTQGDRVLGLYAKAYEVLMLPLTQVNRPVRTVTFPALSRAVASPETYRAAFVGVTEFLSIVVGAMVAFMIVFGDGMITFVLGAQWVEAGRIFMLLGIGGFLLPLWNLSGLVFITQGRAREHLIFHACDLVLKVSSVVIGLQWGVEGVAIAVGVRYYVAVPLLFHMLGRSGPIGAGDLYRLLVLPFAFDLALLGALYGLRMAAFGGEAPPVALAVGLLTTAAITYGVLMRTAVGRRRVQALRRLSDLKVE